MTDQNAVQEQLNAFYVDSLKTVEFEPAQLQELFGGQADWRYCVGAR